MNKFTKILLTALCLVLVVALSVGGTLAWLTDNTETVTNTFTVGDINITLVEHAYNTENTSEITTTVSNENTYKMIPGTTYAKDPTVTVKANSEKCYLFVKLEQVNNPSSYLTYTSMLEEANEGWTKLTDVDNVWYRVVDASANDTSFTLLKDNKVEVKDSIVKGTAGEGEVTMPTTQPQLKYTAYAVQFDNVESAAAAWTLVSK